MAVTGSTALAAVIEKKVSSTVTEVLIQESVSLNTVRNFPVEGGMDRLDIPLFNSMTVASVTEGSALTPETMGVSVAQLNLDRQRAVAWAISKRAEVQSKINATMEAIKMGSKELAAEVDEYLFGLMVAGTGSTEDLTVDYSGDALAAIAGQKKLMDLANVPRSERFIIASPGFTAELLNNNNVINVDKYGSEAPIQAGFVAKVLGFIVVESSAAAIPADGFIACHRAATAFARQINPMLDRDMNVLALQEEFVLSHLYGGILTDSGSNRITIVTNL